MQVSPAKFIVSFVPVQVAVQSAFVESIQYGLLVGQMQLFPSVERIVEPPQAQVPYFPIYTEEGQALFIQYLLSTLKNCKFPIVDGQSATHDV